MGSFDGKVAIVTGTSRGVGDGIAEELLWAGATVVGCSRSPLDELPAAARVPGGRDRSAQWVCEAKSGLNHLTRSLAETVACILEEGFGAASAKHITERANVSWGAIQYHFGDRDQLLMAVVDDGFAGLQQSLANIDIPNGPLRERVSAVVEAAWHSAKPRRWQR